MAMKAAEAIWCDTAMHNKDIVRAATIIDQSFQSTPPVGMKSADSIVDDLGNREARISFVLQKSDIREFVHNIQSDAVAAARLESKAEVERLKTDVAELQTRLIKEHLPEEYESWEKVFNSIRLGVKERYAQSLAIQELCEVLKLSLPALERHPYLPSSFNLNPLKELIKRHSTNPEAK